jgi:Tfp pilus assembly protein PilX
MFNTRQPTTGRHGDRRGSAVILVLLLSMALAALAASAILLSSGTQRVTTYHASERDLRYAADAAVAIGESQLDNGPYIVPSSGYVQLDTNQMVYQADSSNVSGVVYNAWAGPTGAASKQNGRFVTLVVQVNDTLHHRSYVRHVELNQESFAKFAYFSEDENGICFGSGDRLTGPVFSDDAISTCSGQKAEFMDSVETHLTFTNGNPSTDTLYMPPARTGLSSITLPNTTKLAALFTFATTGNTLFDAGYTQNALADSTSEVKQRVEFVAYNPNPAVYTDSTVPGSGFVKYYAINKTTSPATWWTTVYTTASTRDSMETVYLRAGRLHRADALNCGDWHFVRVDGTTAAYEWEFFPAAAHSLSWFQSVLMPGDKEIGATYPATPAAWTGTTGWTDLIKVLGYGNITTNIPTAIAGITMPTTQPAATCYVGGDPHLVAVERMGVTYTGQTGYTGTRTGTTFKQYERGGNDTTFTPVGTLGTWETYTATIPSYLSTFTANHPDYNQLFPIDSVYNPAFKGVVAVYGSVGVSGVVNGHVTLYTDGSASMIDNLRLTTTADTTCEHGMGLVSGNNIMPADNAINMPQHISTTQTPVEKNYAILRQNSQGSDIYVQSTVMALNSWGTENLSEDSTYNTVATVTYGVGSGTSGGDALCNGSYYIRGCAWVYGSILQNSRVTMNGCNGSSPGYNSNWACGYAKQYTYDDCTVENPLPYFPTTGRYTENKYYEADANHFNVASLFAALAQ